MRSRRRRSRKPRRITRVATKKGNGHGHHEPVGRVEDARLITGTGKYAADWSLPGQLYGHFVRSDRAHADIVSIDTAAALKHPGVKTVFTGADAVKAGYVKAPHSLNWPGK